MSQGSSGGQSNPVADREQEALRQRRRADNICELLANQPELSQRICFEGDTGLTVMDCMNRSIPKATKTPHSASSTTTVTPVTSPTPVPKKLVLDMGDT